MTTLKNHLLETGMKALFGMAVACVMLAAAPANAATFQGVEYILTGEYTSAAHNEALFTLNISGINAAADVEGGRYGVNAYAWSKPQGFSTASSPGFTLEVGGLNASGCNGAGNFFCFNDNAPKPTAPPLPAGSELEFTFLVTLLAGFNFDNYDASFKIDWLGTKNNYNLVSQHLGITGGVIDPQISAVPIPPAILLFASGLAGLGALSWRRRKQAAAVA